MSSKKTTRPIHARAVSSLNGLFQGWRREGAIRAHATLSAVGLVALAVGRAGEPWLIASGLLMLAGLSLELVNAAIEALLDQLHPVWDEEIGAAKDMCSAAAFVLNVAAGGAVAVGLVAAP